MGTAPKRVSSSRGRTLWMSKTRPEVVQLLIGTDPTSAQRFLATGPLLNVAEFFTTFNIQPGDARCGARKPIGL